MADFLSSYYEDNDTSWAGIYTVTKTSSEKKDESKETQRITNESEKENSINHVNAENQLTPQASDESDFCVPVASMSLFDTEQRSMVSVQLKTLRSNGMMMKRQSIKPVSNGAAKSCNTDKVRNEDKLKITLRSAVSRLLLGRRKTEKKPF